MTIQISPEVQSVLVRAHIDGNQLKIKEQLDRKLYVEVNKVLEACGGKWSKSASAHVFPSDPMEAIRKASTAETIVDEVKLDKKVRQVFYTPPDVAALLVQTAEVSGCTVLEPSAGQGALVKECYAQGASYVHAVEMDQPSCDYLKALGCGLHCGDFLAVPKDRFHDKFDRVVMNPPFRRDADIKHVAHAMNFVKPGGSITAIMSPNKERKTFNALTAGRDFEMQYLASGRFKCSGTNIAPMILKIHMPCTISRVTGTV